MEFRAGPRMFVWPSERFCTTVRCVLQGGEGGDQLRRGQEVEARSSERRTGGVLVPERQRMQSRRFQELTLVPEDDWGKKF